MDRSRILVVCTANICRSPMAERLLAEFFVRQVEDVDLHISSAGTRARPDHGAAGGMQRVAAAWGLDLSYHRSRRISEDLVSAQSLIVTMEARHSSAVSRLATGVGQRTFTITELVEILDAGPFDAQPGLDAHVDAWHGARARLSLDAPDVADPYGGPEEEYVACAWQLAELVERLGPALAGATRTAP